MKFLFGAAGILLVLLALAGWKIRRDAVQLSALRTERDQVAADFSAYRLNMTAEVGRVNSNAAGYLSELERLRARPVGSIRVPVCPAAQATAGHSTPVTRLDDASAAGRLLPAPAPVDIGPDLEALARDADAVTAQARALQEYIRTLPKQCMLGVDNP